MTTENGKLPSCAGFQRNTVPFRTSPYIDLSPIEIKSDETTVVISKGKDGAHNFFGRNLAPEMCEGTTISRGSNAAGHMGSGFHYRILADRSWNSLAPHGTTRTDSALKVAATSMATSVRFTVSALM